MGAGDEGPEVAKERRSIESEPELYNLTRRAVTVPVWHLRVAIHCLQPSVPIQSTSLRSDNSTRHCAAYCDQTRNLCPPLSHPTFVKVEPYLAVFPSDSRFCYHQYVFCFPSSSPLSFFHLQDRKLPFDASASTPSVSPTT